MKDLPGMVRQLSHFMRLCGDPARVRRVFETGIQERGAHHASAPHLIESTAEPGPGPNDIEQLTIKIPACVLADLTVRYSVDPYEAPVAQLADLAEG